MQIAPCFSISGDYRFRSMNAYDAPAYFYQGHTIYRFDHQQMKVAGAINHSAKLEHATISFHPKLPIAAFHDKDGALTLGGFDGKLLWQGDGSCESSLISNNGAWVWAVFRIDDCNLKAVLYDLRDGTVLSTLDFPDELYKSHVMLSDIPHSHAITMLLAAGQDGTEVHELVYDGSAIRTSELFPKACYITPAWKPDGTRFLTMENDENTLAWYAYPQMEKLKEEPRLEFESEEAWDNANSYYQVYLEDGRAIVQTTNNRYYVYSPQLMKRTEELTIAGFELKPTREIFPSQQGDNSPYCEMECIDRLGRYLVARTCRRGEGAVQGLLIFREAELITSTCGAANC